MKYMTPDLISRFRSADDAVSEAAGLEWESQGEAYRKRLKDIRQYLPSGVRRLLRRYFLHDAKVVTMATDEVPHFSIVLQLDNPSSAGDKYLELRYRLAGGIGKGVEFVQHEVLAADGSSFGWWLYDEIDMREGPVEAFTHSILFSGGYELRLTFFSMQCKRLNFLFPPANNEGAVAPNVSEPAESLKRLVRRPA